MRLHVMLRLSLLASDNISQSDYYNSDRYQSLRVQNASHPLRRDGQLQRGRVAGARALPRCGAVRNFRQTYFSVTSHLRINYALHQRARYIIE